MDQVDRVIYDLKNNPASRRILTNIYNFEDLHEMVRGYLGQGNKMGEGWLLTAEMLELIHSGAGNIVCVQPFGCLPNHIVGKGMMKPIKESIPGANIVAIDYDPGASVGNQENRLKLMLASARHAADRHTMEQQKNGTAHQHGHASEKEKVSV